MKTRLVATVTGVAAAMVAAYAFGFAPPKYPARYPENKGRVP